MVLSLKLELLNSTLHVVRLVADVSPDWGVHELLRLEVGCGFLKGGVNPLITGLLTPESEVAPPTL